MDGLGTLIGAFILAAVSRPSIYGRLYIGGVLLFLVLLPLFALATHPVAAGAALLAVGMGQSAFSVMQATIVYVASPVERRMQAMGVLTMCIGVGPLGFLFLGWLAEQVGASPAAVISAGLGNGQSVCDYYRAEVMLAEMSGYDLDPGFVADYEDILGCRP